MAWVLWCKSSFFGVLLRCDLSATVLDAAVSGAKLTAKSAAIRNHACRTTKQATSAQAQCESGRSRQGQKRWHKMRWPFLARNRTCWKRKEGVPKAGPPLGRYFVYVYLYVVVMNVLLLVLVLGLGWTVVPQHACYTLLLNGCAYLSRHLRSANEHPMQSTVNHSARTTERNSVFLLSGPRWWKTHDIRCAHNHRHSSVQAVRRLPYSDHHNDAVSATAAGHCAAPTLSFGPLFESTNP